MTTYLGKSCSFGLPRVPCVNCGQFMYLVISIFGFEGRMWDLIVSVPDHCLSFYFPAVALKNSVPPPINLTAEYVTLTARLDDHRRITFNLTAFRYHHLVLITPKHF